MPQTGRLVRVFLVMLALTMRGGITPSWPRASVQVLNGYHPTQQATLARAPLTMRLVSYNIRHGAGLDDQVNLERVAETLRAADPDVILLNEVDANWRRSGFVDQASALASMLSLPYVAFAPAMVRRNVRDAGVLGAAYYGNALLSNYPIDHVETIRLPGSALQEPRVVLSADLRIDSDRLLRVYGTHLGLDHADRMAQVNTLLRLSGEHDGPRVLMGDFNAATQTPEIQSLLTAVADAYPQVRQLKPVWVDPMAAKTAAPTFPAHQPTRRIDYILVSPDLAEKVTYYESPYSEASDHLPVLAELDL